MAALRALALAVGILPLVQASVLADAAEAAPGGLSQKPGLAGCISDTGVGPCVDGTGLAVAELVTVSPDGRSAYLAGAGSDAVAVFDRAADGALTQKPGTAGCVSDSGRGPCADGTALGGANTVAVSPDGRHVYVGAFISGAVAVFDRAADGTLTQKPGTEACISDTGIGPCADGTALLGPETVTVSPDGKSVYVAATFSESVAIFDRAADGALTQKPGTAGCISDSGSGPCVDGTGLDGASSVTVSLDGSSAYAAAINSAAVAVFDRAADGALTQKPGTEGCISDTGSGPCTDGTALGGASWVTLSPDGRSAYVASFVSRAVAVFDRASDGRLSQKPGAAGCLSAAAPCSPGKALDGALATTVSPDGRSVYVAASSSDAVAVFDRAADGGLTQKPGTEGCISDTGSGPCVDGTALDGAGSVAVSPDGGSVYVAGVTGGALAIFDREPTLPAPTSPVVPPQPSADTTRPLLGPLSFSPTRFRAARRGSSMALAGARVSYRLSEAASVAFRVQRVILGRRAGGRCVAPRRPSRGARRCVRFESLRGRFTDRGNRGENRFMFTGRLGARRLPAGRYRLRAVATDRAGNRSRSRGRRFRIVRR